MKKLLSILLTAALLASFACIGVSAETTLVTSDKTYSLVKDDASAYTKVPGGDGNITVTKDGDSMVFTADKGWPNAYVSTENNDEMLAADFSDEDIYLNWDFEVKSGGAKVVVYLCGQSPEGSAPMGNFITLNGLINPEWYDPMSGDTANDLGVGVYKGSIKLADLFYQNINIMEAPFVNPDLFIDNGEGVISRTNFSGYKVFAVGGTVVVNDLSLGQQAFGGTAPQIEYTNLLTNGSTNGSNGESTVTFDEATGSYKVNVTTAWDSSTNIAYGMQVAADLNGIDLSGKYLHVGIKSDVPFRITTLDKSDAGNKWILLCNEFYNVIGPVGQDPIGSCPEGSFFPAGEYEICVAYHGIYDWQTSQGTAGWDTKNANLNGIYFEAKTAGSFTVSTLKLSAEPTFSATPGTNTGEAAGNDDVTTGNPGTGDNTQAIVFMVIAMAAAGVVTLSAVAKKAKSR